MAGGVETGAAVVAASLPPAPGFVPDPGAAARLVVEMEAKVERESRACAHQATPARSRMPVAASMPTHAHIGLERVPPS